MVEYNRRRQIKGKVQKWVEHQRNDMANAPTVWRAIHFGLCYITSLSPFLSLLAAAKTKPFHCAFVYWHDSTTVHTPLDYICLFFSSVLDPTRVTPERLRLNLSYITHVHAMRTHVYDTFNRKKNTILVRCTFVLIGQLYYEIIHLCIHKSFFASSPGIWQLQL